MNLYVASGGLGEEGDKDGDEEERGKSASGDKEEL